MLKTLLIKKFDGKKIEMMIIYDMHPHSKTHNLKIVVLQIFRNSKCNSRMLNFEESFANVNGS
jgi:hypothetical protein